MEDIKTNWFKTYVIDVLPCITVALYVLAFIYNIAFFSVYNINIVHYISLSEMLISILDVIIAVALFSLAFLWFNLYTYTFLNSIPNNELKDSYKTTKSYIWLNNKVLLIKNTKVFTFLSKNKKNFESKTHNKEVQNFSIYYKAILLILVSLFFFMYNRSTGDIEKGLLGATFGISYPLLLFGVYSMFSFVVDYCLSRPLNKSLSFFNYKTREILGVIILLYFYAIMIFYISGVDSGNYYKENNLASFTIKTNDEKIYTDLSYRYINRVNEKFFLLDKITNENVILGKESISYIKIFFYDDMDSPVIVRIINSWRRNISGIE